MPEEGRSSSWGPPQARYNGFADEGRVSQAMDVPGVAPMALQSQNRDRYVPWPFLQPEPEHIGVTRPAGYRQRATRPGLQGAAARHRGSLRPSSRLCIPASLFAARSCMALALPCPPTDAGGDAFKEDLPSARRTGPSSRALPRAMSPEGRSRRGPQRSPLGAPARTRQRAGRPERDLPSPFRWPGARPHRTRDAIAAGSWLRGASTFVAGQWLLPAPCPGCRRAGVRAGRLTEIPG